MARRSNGAQHKLPPALSSACSSPVHPETQHPTPAIVYVNFTNHPSYFRSFLSPNPLYESDPLFAEHQDTLVYSCICDNGQSPNASEYSQTIPYFLCTEENNNCVAACSQGDSSCQENCRTSNPCGAQNPKLVNTTSTNGSSTATSTATSTTSSLAPFTGLPNDDEGAAVRPVTDLRQVYGLFAVLGGFFAGFTILL
ncbi:hypothetical protein BDW66DRAFT_131680 [Aspergillus desertorum]